MKRPFAIIFSALLLTTVAAPVSAQQAISVHKKDERDAARLPAFQWREARVDPSSEHFDLRFGSIDDDWTDWKLIARVGRAVGGIFQVEWLTDSGAAPHESIDAVTDQLDYYLVDLDKCDPWKYLEYHVTTLANVYSDVHWSHVMAR